MGNAFDKQMTRLYKQPHMGDQFSIAGMTLTVDKDGGYDVPPNHVDALLSHGFTRERITAEMAAQDVTAMTLAAARKLVAEADAKADAPARKRIA